MPDLPPCAGALPTDERHVPVHFHAVKRSSGRLVGYWCANCGLGLSGQAGTLSAGTRAALVELRQIVKQRQEVVHLPGWGEKATRAKPVPGCAQRLVGLISGLRFPK